MLSNKKCKKLFAYISKNEKTYVVIIYRGKNNLYAVACTHEELSEFIDQYDNFGDKYIKQYLSLIERNSLNY